MGFKEKMAEGIDATGVFPFAKVDAAVSNAADAMGPKAMRVASSNEQDGIIWLELFKTGKENVMHRNLLEVLVEAGMKEKIVAMTACVSLEAGEGGKASISVDIAEATTSHETVMFVPVTPKSVHGLAAYRGFLNHFENELKKIDPRASISKR